MVFFLFPQNYWNYSLCELGAARIWYRAKCFRFDLCTDFDLVSVIFMTKTSFALRNHRMVWVERDLKDHLMPWAGTSYTRPNTMEHSYSDISGCFSSWGGKNTINAWEGWHIKCLCKDCDLPVLFVIMQETTIPCGHLVWEKPVKGTS